jgi:sodium transport system permease protein
MKARNVFTVFAKELRDTLRDRRAVISMFLVPTVIMPLITLGFAAVSMKIARKAHAEIPRVMIVGGDDSPRLRQTLEALPSLKIVPTSSNFTELISQKRLRAAAAIPDGFDEALRNGTPSTIKIYTHDGEMRSSLATSALERALREYREQIVSERLRERGLTAQFIRPFEMKRENVAAPEKVGGSAFGGFIPYLLIILCFTGAMYPAIDLTAGEKERGTLETILCSPVGRTELVLGKFLVVLTASLATVVCSIASMAASSLIFANFSGVRALVSAGQALPTISIPGVLGVMVLLIPLALLFSAVLMTVALFAKSYKEAQTYVSPLLVIVMLPAIAAVLPGVELSTGLSLIPILNIALVSKELVAGVFPAWPLTLIFLSTCVYAGIALALSVRMFNREDVIFRA